jgi:uncharacterized membrane protein HdeD (DUF308 family)
MAQNIIEGAVNRAWWGLVLRGSVAIALGIFILARPLASVAAFALVIAIWALVDGITNIIHAFDLRPYLSQWWWMLLGGIISAGFGVAALYYYPGLSLSFAVVWTAWWLLLTGCVATYAAFQQRSAGLPWGWTMAFGGLSVVAGVVALIYQPATLAAIMGFISAFAIVGGVLLLMGAAKLKSAERDVTSAVRTAVGGARS